MKKLTARQAQILGYIRGHVDATGMPPTRAEISAHFGFASASVADNHLRLIARKGEIELVKGSARGIRLPETESPPSRAASQAANDGLLLPLVGQIAAGEPVLADQNIEDHYQVDPRLFHPQPHFLRQISGHSMVDAGIQDGDFAAIHHTQDIRDRQIVAFRFGEDMTLKRYFRHGHQIELRSENHEQAQHYPTMTLDLREETLRIGEDRELDLRGSIFAIEGVYVGVIRPYRAR